MLIFLSVTNIIKPFVFTKPQDIYHALIIGYAGGSLGLLANAVFIDVFAASKIAITYWILTGFILGIIKIISRPN